MNTTYDGTTWNGERFCAKCGCAEAMHDEFSLRCPRDDDPRWLGQSEPQ